MCGQFANRYSPTLITARFFWTLGPFARLSFWQEMYYEDEYLKPVE